MMRKDRIALLGSAAMALTLSACMYPDGSIAPAPGVYSDQLAADDYMWIDRAESLWQAIGDAPPDHAFEFQGAEPWAWILEDGHTIIVEDDGTDLRSYYFSPGADAPFLAVEPGRSFAFDGPRVIVVYGADGRALPRDRGSFELDKGGVLYARGRELLRAMLRGERRSVDAMVWLDTSPVLWGYLQQWDYGLRSNYGWRAYRGGSASSEWRRHFDGERQRRDRLSDAFRRWREGNFQGPPPGRWRGGARPANPGTTVPRQPGQGRWTGPRPTPNGQVPGATTPGQQGPGRWTRGPRPTPNGAVPPGASVPDQQRPNRWQRGPRPAPSGAAPGATVPDQSPNRWQRGPRATPNGAVPPGATVPNAATPGRWNGVGRATPNGQSGSGASRPWMNRRPDGDAGRPAPSWRSSAPDRGGSSGGAFSAPRYEAPRAAPPPPPPPAPSPAPAPAPAPAPTIRADDTAPN